MEPFTLQGPTRGAGPGGPGGVRDPRPRPARGGRAGLAPPPPSGKPKGGLRPWGRQSPAGVRHPSGDLRCGCRARPRVVGIRARRAATGGAARGPRWQVGAFRGQGGGGGPGEAPRSGRGTGREDASAIAVPAKPSRPGPLPAARKRRRRFAAARWRSCSAGSVAQLLGGAVAAGPTCPASRFPRAPAAGPPPGSSLGSPPASSPQPRRPAAALPPALLPRLLSALGVRVMTSPYLSSPATVTSLQLRTAGASDPSSFFQAVPTNSRRPGRFQSSLAGPRRAELPVQGDHTGPKREFQGRVPGPLGGGSG